MPGASLAHAMSIDALDSHDTCKDVKGHASVALIPAALDTLALSERPVSGRELITTITMACDVAIRAGQARSSICLSHSPTLPLAGSTQLRQLPLFPVLVERAHDVGQLRYPERRTQ